MRLLFMGKRPECFSLLTVMGIVSNLLAGGFSQEGSRADQVLNWDKVLVAYDAYVDYPSQDNAKALLAALPTDRQYETSGDTERALEQIFSENYQILWEEATSGDRIAIEYISDC